MIAYENCIVHEVSIFFISLIAYKGEQRAEQKNLLLNAQQQASKPASIPTVSRINISKFHNRSYCTVLAELKRPSY